jgi:ribonuclease P protein component
VMPEAGRPGWDYVLVARADTLTRPFVQLTEDLRAAALALARATDKGPGK